MAIEDKDRPDGSSIKPVSSLRAQFEDIAIRKSIPPLKATKPTFLGDAEPERGRSSLDMPRAMPIWSAYEQSPPASSRIPASGTSRNLHPGQLSSQPVARARPVSMMEPWSPPQSAPSLMLQTPMSPPKPLTSPSPDRLLSKPVTTQETPQKHFISSPPTRQIQRDLTGTPSISYSAPNRSRQPSPGTFKRPPPPINRASKPSTPTVSNFGSVLGLVDNESKDKISPFSTPPSSAGSSPVRGQSPVRRESPIRRQPTGPIIPASNYVPPPLVHHSIEARRERIAELRQLHDHSQTQVNVLDMDDPSLRPGLPSRAIAPAQPARPPTNSNATQNTPTQSTRQFVPAPVSVRAADKDKSNRPPEFLPPPPKRNLIPSKGTDSPRVQSSPTPPSMSRSSSGLPALPARNDAAQSTAISTREADSSIPNDETASVDTPDGSQANRRPPKTKCGSQRVWTQYDTKSLELCGNHVCTGGYVFRSWDISNARMITDYAPDFKELKVTAFAFKPGSKPEEEGLFVWIGNNVGAIQEIDLKRQIIVEAKPDAHGRREIVKIFRHQNSIWSLDDEGKLLIWAAASNGIPNLRQAPTMLRLHRGHTCSIIVKDHLWVAASRNIYIYNPKAGEKRFSITSQPLSHPSAADVTCAAVVSSQLDRVYFGHSDGKISIYSTSSFSCLGLISASPYKINCLAGAGAYLWAGFNTGMIYVYDTQSKPWKIKKEWHAHGKHPVSSIVVDLSSVWKFGHLQVASMGTDNAICFWDGMLEDDWIEHDMQQRDVEYCTFNEISAAIMTWNAGASTPGRLRHDQSDSNFFREAIRAEAVPDILFFGFQELVDLEDKKLTAKSIFKGSKKKDSAEADHMSHQYRAWRDYLTHMIEDFMPQTESYALLHTASMVGLFSCIFVKSQLRGRIRNLKVAEVKRGLGGLHGNKGAIILRFILDDTSICLTNCHLAAGQTQTASRNSDITAILESMVLPEEKDSEARMSNYIGGGDGAMIMDHEICVVNGDLNYRIDTMSRDTIIKAIKSDNLSKLLERDQLLVSKRRNPGFRLRSFKEQPLTFIPTYKYDVGTDRFDTSEKARSPAWCDRILYRGAGRVKQIDYRRHELKLSDHRPVSALFYMRIKTVDHKRRAVTRDQAEDRLADVREALAEDAKLGYLVNTLGVEEGKARKMLAQQAT